MLMWRKVLYFDDQLLQYNYKSNDQILLQNEKNNHKIPSLLESILNIKIIIYEKKDIVIFCRVICFNICILWSNSIRKGYKDDEYEYSYAFVF